MHKMLIHICKEYSHMSRMLPYMYGMLPYTGEEGRLWMMVGGGRGRRGCPALPDPPCTASSDAKIANGLCFCISVFVFLYLYFLILPDTQHPDAKSWQCFTIGVYVCNVCMDICIFNIVKDWAMACFYLLADRGPLGSAMQCNHTFIYFTFLFSSQC